MDLVFGGEFDYDRVGLVLISAGMGLYLAAATLNQALLARGRARAACGCWAAAAAAFVGFLLLPGFDDRVLQVEVGLRGRGADPGPGSRTELLRADLAGPRDQPG